MERNKNIGNIPDARQKLCKGKFKMFNSICQVSKSDSIKPTKINIENYKTKKREIKYCFFKTGGFLGKYN